MWHVQVELVEHLLHSESHDCIQECSEPLALRQLLATVDYNIAHILVEAGTNVVVIVAFFEDLRK